MIKRLLLIALLGVSVSGCFVAPLALIGPATSGFSTASIIQAGVSSGANYMVKKSTGKTITEHAIESINKETLQSWNEVVTIDNIKKPIPYNDLNNQLKVKPSAFVYWSKTKDQTDYMSLSNMIKKQLALIIRLTICELIAY